MEPGDAALHVLLGPRPFGPPKNLKNGWAMIFSNLRVLEMAVKGSVKSTQLHWLLLGGMWIPLADLPAMQRDIAGIR